MMSDTLFCLGKGITLRLEWLHEFIKRIWGEIDLKLMKISEKNGKNNDKYWERGLLEILNQENEMKFCIFKNIAAFLC